MSSRLRIAFLCLLLACALGTHAVNTTPAPDAHAENSFAFGPETWTETAAATARPKPAATCVVINGVSAYLGCRVTEGGTTTTYYNCTHHPQPCMDKADCLACTNIPSDD